MWEVGGEEEDVTIVLDRHRGLKVNDDMTMEKGEYRWDIWEVTSTGLDTYDYARRKTEV